MLILNTSPSASLSLLSTFYILDCHRFRGHRFWHPSNIVVDNCYRYHRIIT
ncbi:MAG: hypothetical protein IPQ28_15940 [Sphingobacteriales bacterium]|nr:hypothetical protein [Sphingobacteriales bacterium]